MSQVQEEQQEEQQQEQQQSNTCSATNYGAIWCNIYGANGVIFNITIQFRSKLVENRNWSKYANQNLQNANQDLQNANLD
jgi:hypothetical protein